MYRLFEAPRFNCIHAMYRLFEASRFNCIHAMYRQKWRPNLRQMLESMLCQTLQMRVASDTETVLSSAGPK